jgi:hypothetical protein
MAPDYDATDPAPTTEAIATSYMDCVEDATWKDIKCSLSTAAMFPMGPRKYVRTSEVPGSKKVFDAGNLWLCTVEEAGTDAIGKLWVEYDIDLFVPQTISSVSTALAGSYYTNTAAQVVATGVGELVDFGTIVDSLGIGDFTAGVVTPPKGSYLVQGLVTVTDDTAETFTILLNLQKNGAALTPRPQCSQVRCAGGAAQCFSVPFLAQVDCNGTDTIGVFLTATGAAGALSVVDEASNISITVA